VNLLDGVTFEPPPPPLFVTWQAPQLTLAEAAVPDNPLPIVIFDTVSAPLVRVTLYDSVSPAATLEVGPVADTDKVKEALPSGAAVAAVVCQNTDTMLKTVIIEITANQRWEVRLVMFAPLDEPK